MAIAFLSLVPAKIMFMCANMNDPHFLLFSGSAIVIVQWLWMKVTIYSELWPGILTSHFSLLKVSGSQLFSRCRKKCTYCYTEAVLFWQVQRTCVCPNACIPKRNVKFLGVSACTSSSKIGKSWDQRKKSPLLGTELPIDAISNLGDGILVCCRYWYWKYWCEWVFLEWLYALLSGHKDFIIQSFPKTKFNQFEEKIFKEAKIEKSATLFESVKINSLLKCLYENIESWCQREN